MEEDGDDSGAILGADEDYTSSSVNKLILDYYKKFGRKRDLEQYFSLSTAQNDVKDLTGSFWSKMKSQDDTSDSGGKRSESSQELCRISIKCSLPDPSSSLDENTKTKSNPESPAKSPPIVVDDCVEDVAKNSDDDFIKSDDNHSQKSFDLLDTSINPRSPTSSITSQRKLEWDSLADVGYANETDRKNSASSLSTLEKLALKQQYSNNDTEKVSQLGVPTAQSTPLDENDMKLKSKRAKKTKIYRKDIDFVEVSVPQNIDNNNTSQSINVNLTKHISFNVQKDGGVTIENVTNDINVKKSPEKFSVQTEVTPQKQSDKEMQTTSVNTAEKSVYSDIPKKVVKQKLPIMISLNTLRKRNKRKKSKTTRKKLNTKRKTYHHHENKNIQVQDKSGEQLSEAESFEYMPGHVYNQNHMKLNQSKSVEAAGNKSSLESSGLLTTDSSKGSKHSFKKDLEKSVDILKIALQQHYNDDKLKKKLIKEVIQRLLSSTYRDDESTTDFLSGLSFKSNKIGLGDSNHTTSTSDGNTLDKAKIKPKKSILRIDKFNSNAIASTSQSAPNLPVATNSDHPFASNLIKSAILSNTETDTSSREKMSSDNGFAKTSSEELYQKYLEALRKEEAYKKHLKDKEILLKQKLKSSESVFKVPPQLENKVNNRMKELMKDLTRNNYDDGSGDASKLEGSSNIGFERFNRSQRSHSVFTLSSGHSESPSRKQNQKKRLKSDTKDINKAGTSKRDHYCCCPHHSSNIKGVTDSSVQVNVRDLSLEQPNNQVDNKHVCPQSVNLESGRNVAHFISDIVTGDVRYVCLCKNKVVTEEVPDNYLIYKCSRLTNIGVQSDEMPCNIPELVTEECENNNQPEKIMDHLYQAHYLNSSQNNTVNSIESSSSVNIPIKKPSKSSQTNLLLKMLCGKSSNQNVELQNIQKKDPIFKANECSEVNKKKFVVHEATRSLQTEISINPKISDPCLSDINIMNDMDCFKLVSEQQREVSRHSLEIDSRNREIQSDVEASTSNENVKQSSSKDSQTCLVTDLYKEQPIIDDTYLRNQGDIPLITEHFGDNFTIPIQGTNMLLMVKIGSNIKAPELKQNEIVNEGIETEKLSNKDKSTCLTEECSKSVQNDNTAKNIHVNDYIKHSSNNATSMQTKEPYKVSCVVNACDISKNKYSTYPKLERKPLLRSNTNTEMVENVDFKQDALSNKVESQTVFEHFDEQSSIENIDNIDVTTNVSYNEHLDEPCPCGCSLKSKKCKGVCGDIKDNSSITDTKNSDIECNPTNIVHYQANDNYTRNTDNPKVLADRKIDSSDLIKRDMQNVINKKEIAIQKDLPKERNKSGGFPEINMPKVSSGYSKNLKYVEDCGIQKGDSDKHCSCNKKSKIQETSTDTKSCCESTHSSDKKIGRSGVLNSVNSMERNTVAESVLAQDPVLNMIKDITKRYSKTDVERNKRKKCFKEIVTVLNYLLDTDESSDNKQSANECANCSSQDSKESDASVAPKMENRCVSCQTKTLVDKAVQLTAQKKKEKPNTESDVPTYSTTDVPETSTDSATCKVLNKIKKECEKYHQKRCKSYTGKMCEVSSSSSANCDKCRRQHHCSCRSHKCKRPKSDKPKKPVAYNLIIQTSESMVSEETVCDEQCRTLKNIVVKVPSRYKKFEKAPFKEVACKIEQKMTLNQSPRCDKAHRSRSLPNEYEISSSRDLRAGPGCTIRDYLEKNRPDFVEKCSQRQNCLKYISESRANERAAHRDLLSMHVDRESPLSALSLGELRHLAKEIGIDASAHKQPKLISEKEMKKRSDKIYKSLPEVVRKKEELKKQNIKKTNLLMASIFKKNLQKKALRGLVNLSNYSTVIKI